MRQTVLPAIIIAILSVVLAGCLVLWRKHTRTYKRIIKAELEKLDALIPQAHAGNRNALITLEHPYWRRVAKDSPEHLRRISEALDKGRAALASKESS